MSIKEKRYLVFWIGLFVPLILLIFLVFPFIYNEHISSLGRFSKIIEEGMPEDLVTERMKSFQMEHAKITTLHEGIFVIDLYGFKMAKSKIISLNQKSLFEDMQLRILFKNKKVEQKLFISD